MVFEKILKFQPTRKHYCLPNSHLELPCETNYVIYTTWLLSIYKHIYIYIFLFIFIFVVWISSVCAHTKMHYNTRHFIFLHSFFPLTSWYSVYCLWADISLLMKEQYSLYRWWMNNLTQMEHKLSLSETPLSDGIYFDNDNHMVQVFLFELFVPSWTYIKCHQFTRTKL